MLKIKIGIVLIAGILGVLGIMAFVTYQRETIPLDCLGSARCFTGKVTKIIDGDTIKVDGDSIRFALVNTPEEGEDGFYESRNFIAGICPVGSTVLVDEDDYQTGGSYGRTIAEIHCNGVSLNEKVLEANLAEISRVFCSESEFSSESWAKNNGC